MQRFAPSSLLPLRRELRPEIQSAGMSPLPSAHLHPSARLPSSLHISLTALQIPRLILSTAPPPPLPIQMPCSLLLHRLTEGARLLLGRVASRGVIPNQQQQRHPPAIRIAPGVGVQVALDEDKPDLDRSISHEQDSPTQPQCSADPTRSPDEKPTKPTRAQLLALVAARDAANDQPVLTQALHPPQHPISLPLSSEQESVLLARLRVLDAMLSEQFLGEDAPDQLVLFAPGLHVCPLQRQSLASPLAVFAVNDAALAVPAAAEAARLHAALPDHVDYIHVDAVLDGFVWDSALVLHGYNWQRPSLWLLILDVADFDHDRLHRHFRMIGTLASLDSHVLVAYVTSEFVTNVRECSDEQWTSDAPVFSCDDPFAFAKKCGFQVSYATSLRDAAIKYGLPAWLRKRLATSLFADGIRFATFSHSQRNLPPVTSDVDSVSEATALSGFSATASAASAAAPATPLPFADHSSIGEFEDYVSSDTRMFRFEIQVGSIPWELARPEFSVVLIGSESTIGCWDPKRAKKMYGNICGGSGVMTADLSLSVEACDVEYKYAITNARQEIVAWESGSNRVLASLHEDTVPGNVQYVRDEWRCQ